MAYWVGLSNATLRDVAVLLQCGKFPLELSFFDSLSLLNAPVMNAELEGSWSII